MAAQGAITRRILYDKIPEIERIDLQIGFNYSFTDSFNVNTFISDYKNELSNVISSGGDLNEFYTSERTWVYIRTLENYIIKSNSASGDELSQLFQTKIELLENKINGI